MTAIQIFGAVAPLSRLGSLQLRWNYGRLDQLSIIPNITPRWIDPAGETTLSTL